ncbi:MAG TPA: MFS transporter [Bacillales bacterium]|nr:MFS transporter [Bacillales bacterium]
MFHLFQNSGFLKLWIAQLVSQFGNGVTEILLIYLVSQLTHNPLVIGMVIFAQLLPTAVFGLFLGPLADRFSRRFLMVFADFYRAGIVIIMIFSQDSALALLALIVLHGLGSALFTPARSSAIPDVVGEEQVSEAISLSQGTYAAMRIIGPAVGGLLLIIHQPTIIFTMDAITFILSGLLILSMRRLGKVSAGKFPKGESYFRSIRYGIKGVWGLHSLRFLLISLIPVVFTLGVLNTNLAAVLLLKFKVPAVHFGFLEGLLGCGAIIGSLVAPKVLEKIRPGYMLLATIGFIGTWMVLLIPLETVRHIIGLPSVYFWCGMVGLLNALINVPISSLFIKMTPKAFRGRGAALLQAIMNASQMLGLILGGWLAGQFGVLPASAFAGTMLIVLVFLLPLLKGFRTLSNPEVVRRTGATSSME